MEIFDTHNFEKLDLYKIKRVVEYFNKVGPNFPSTVTEIGVSGSLMMSLVGRRMAKVVGQRESFCKVKDDLYRKFYINLYVLTITPAQLWDMYSTSVKLNCVKKKEQAELYVESAKEKLNEVTNILEKLKSFNV